MEFKLSFDWGKKKSIENTFHNNTPPELWGNSYFYQLQQATQNDQALINMYNELPEVQAPVNYIIDSLSVIPYRHVTMKGDKEVVVENSPYIELLRNPNQYQTENDYIKTYFLNRIVLGVGYVNYLKSIGFKASGQLFVLPSENTEIVLASDDKDYRLNEIVGFETSFGGSVIELDKDDVFVNRESTLGVDSYIQTRSRLMSAVMTSKSLRSNYDARIAIVDDRGSTGIIAPTEQGSTISTPDAKAMREKYYQDNGITKGRFPFLISPRPLGFTSTSMNAAELELLANKSDDFKIVCNTLGVDPALFGLGNVTYNNKKLAATAYWENVGIPYFQNYLQFTKTILGMPENDFLKADYSTIAAMQEDFDKITSATSKAWNDGVITEAEYRESIGKEGGTEKKKGDRASDTNTQGSNTE